MLQEVRAWLSDSQHVEYFGASTAGAFDRGLAAPGDHRGQGRAYTERAHFLCARADTFRVFRKTADGIQADLSRSHQTM